MKPKNERRRTPHEKARRYKTSKLRRRRIILGLRRSRERAVDPTEQLPPTRSVHLKHHRAKALMRAAVYAERGEDRSKPKAFRRAR